MVYWPAYRWYISYGPQDHINEMKYYDACTPRLTIVPGLDAFGGLVAAGIRDGVSRPLESMGVPVIALLVSPVRSGSARFMMLV